MADHRRDQVTANELRIKVVSTTTSTVRSSRQSTGTWTEAMTEGAGKTTYMLELEHVMPQVCTGMYTVPYGRTKSGTRTDGGLDE